MKSCMLVCLLVAAYWTCLFPQRSWSYEIIAFKGLNQSVREDLKPGPADCTARMIHKEDHKFIENTIPSLKAAFELGATMGHFNIHRTADGEIVAFHDYSLECRTEGKGITKEQSLDALKKLDVGFGYSFDNGQSYPLRGTGIGLMPTLGEILATFPNQRFVVNEKDNEARTIQALAKSLSILPKSAQENLYYLGEQTELVRELIPNLHVVNSKAGIRRCVTWWLMTNWFGYVHPSCRNTFILLPVSEVKKHRFLFARFQRFLHEAGSKLWIFEVNSAEDAELVKTLNPDGVGTYRIDKTIGLLR